MHVAILGGGGARQLSTIYSGFQSRSLVELPGSRLLDYIYNAVQRYGVDTWFVSDDEKAVAYAASLGLRIVRQSGEGLRAALRSLAAELRGFVSRDEPEAVIYGDVYAEPDFYRQPLAASERGLLPSIVVTVPAYIHDRFLRVELSDVEPLVTRVGEGGFVYAGACLLRFRDLEEWLKAADTASFFSKLPTLYYVQWLGPWVDMDTPWDYMVAVRLHLDKLRGVYVDEAANVSSTAVLEGPVYVDAEARVDHYAVVKGPAYIGKGCMIGANSFIRDHAFMAAHSIVGAFTEFKRSILLRRGYIGSHCYIADSIVGESASISPFTVTRNIIYDIERVPEDVRITTSIPLEKLKLGAIIKAGSRIEPHSTIQPLSVV